MLPEIRVGWFFCQFLRPGRLLQSLGEDDVLLALGGRFLFPEVDAVRVVFGINWRLLLGRSRVDSWLLLGGLCFHLRLFRPLFGGKVFLGVHRFARPVFRVWAVYD